MPNPPVARPPLSTLRDLINDHPYATWERLPGGIIRGCDVRLPNGVVPGMATLTQKVGSWSAELSIGPVRYYGQGASPSAAFTEALVMRDRAHREHPIGSSEVA